jgi:glycine dehydrogenase subunit 2
MNHHEPLLNELSAPGRRALSLPPAGTKAPPLPGALQRPAGSLKLPEVDQLTLVRHFTRLSQLNFSIDTEFYPLGSCTMKYNPRVNEAAAALPGFRDSHPLLDPASCQGSLGLMHRLQTCIAALSGFQAVSLQPAAGAHGELAGVLMIQAWQRARGQDQRTRMLVPDSAHGTNPATCTMAGLETVSIPSAPDGGIDLDALKAALDERTAGLMVTNPTTLGLFERNIRQICDLVHAAGGLVYGDGANMNAIAGIAKPAELGIDVMHFNLHKTFSTPHGGGGPGAGAVGANATLAPYLPGPVVALAPDGGYRLERPAQGIGALKAFWGNFGVLVRAYTYIRMLGPVGLRAMAEGAVLNANYLRVLVGGHYRIPYDRTCMHEFVAQPPEGSHTIDIAKRLIDYGCHPPTIYFPLIVPEAMMIEPTETESRQTLERFAEILAAIAAETRDHPELLLEAPHDTPVSRLDEVAAARKPLLCWC